MSWACGANNQIATVATVANPEKRSPYEMFAWHGPPWSALKGVEVRNGRSGMSVEWRGEVAWGLLERTERMRRVKDVRCPAPAKVSSDRRRRGSSECKEAEQGPLMRASR